MGEKYIINIGDNSYEATRGYVNQCIKIAKDAMKKTSKMAIVALEKDNVIIMSKETFINRDEFNKSINDYINKGFTVHKIRR